MKNVVVIGSSGRLGRMLRASWCACPDLPFRPLFQSRCPPLQPQSEPDLIWSPEDGPHAFAAALHTTLSTEPSSPMDATMIVLAGVTPSSPGRLEENTPITSACLKAALVAGFRRVLVVSSSAVYGTAHPPHPLCEEAPLIATSNYGRQKKQMEQLCDAPEWAGLEISVLRIGNVAGADALMLNHAKDPAASLDLDVFADGKGVLRSYIGPETLSRVFQSLIRAQRPLPKLLNISAPHPLYMDDLAEAANIAWRPRPAPVGLRHSITLDVTRLETLHRFAPSDSCPRTMLRQMKKVGLYDDRV